MSGPQEGVVVKGLQADPSSAETWDDDFSPLEEFDGQNEGPGRVDQDLTKEESGVSAPLPRSTLSRLSLSARQNSLHVAKKNITGPFTSGSQSASTSSSATGNQKAMQLFSALENLDFASFEHANDVATSLASQTSNAAQPSSEALFPEISDFEDSIEEMELKLAFGRGRKDVMAVCASLCSLSVLKQLAGDTSSAMKDIDKAIASLENESGEKALALRARCLLEKGLIHQLSHAPAEMAQAAFAEAHAVVPNQHQALRACIDWSLGSLQLESGDIQEALFHVISSAHISFAKPRERETNLSFAGQLACSLEDDIKTLYKPPTLLESLFCLAQASQHNAKWEMSSIFLRKAAALAVKSGDAVSLLSATAKHNALAKHLRSGSDMQIVSTEVSESDDDSEEEDWDLEIQNEENFAQSDQPNDADRLQTALQLTEAEIARRNVAAILVNPAVGSHNVGFGHGSDGAGPVPDGHLVVQEILKKPEHEVQRFCRSPSLIWALTDQGRRMLGEAEMQDWVAQFASTSDDACLLSNPPHISDLESSIQYMPAGSREWASDSLRLVLLLFFRNLTDECWKCIQSCFIIILGATKPLAELDEEEIREKRLVSHVVWDMLEIGALLWKPSTASAFKGFLASASSFTVLDLPTRQTLIRLACTMHHAHLNQAEARNSMTQLFDCIVGIVMECPCAQQIVGEGGSTLKLSLDKHFACFLDCLSMILIYSQGFSSLNFQPLHEDAITAILQWNSDEHQQAMRDIGESGNALAKHCVQSFETLSGVAETLYNTMAVFKGRQSSQIERLKAKCCFALGLHYSSKTNTEISADATLTSQSSQKSNLHLAESLMFECTWTLEKIEPYVEGFPQSVSLLAFSALQRLSSIWNALNKYALAKEALESCMRLHQLLHARTSPDLHRRLAAMAFQHRDIETALKYYQRILSHAREAGVTAEILFVSERVADLLLLQGELGQAEDFLAAASAYVAPSASGTSTESLKVEASFLHLQLRLASVLSSSVNIHRAATVLENLLCCSIPQGKRVHVLTQLTKAYLKNGWIKEAMGSVAMIIRAHPIMNQNLAQKGPFAKSVQEVQTLGANLYDTAARICYKGGLILEALEWNAKAQTFKSALAVQASRSRLEGMLLAKLAHPETSVSFPVTIGAKINLEEVTDCQDIEMRHAFDMAHDHLASIGGLIPSCEERKYSSTEDIVHDSAMAFQDAINVYNSLGDAYRAGKCYTGLSSLLLEPVFPLVALLNLPLDSALVDEGAPSERTLLSLEGNHVGPSEPSRRASAQLYVRCILNICKHTIETAERCQQPLMTLDALISMAEMKRMSGDMDVSITYWSETRQLFELMFMDADHNIKCAAFPVMQQTKIFDVFSRICRYVLSLSPEIIQKYMYLIQSCLDYETDMWVKVHSTNDLAATSLQGGLKNSDNGSLGSSSASTASFGSKIPSWSRSSLGSGKKMPTVSSPQLHSRLGNTTFPPQASHQTLRNMLHAGKSLGSGMSSVSYSTHPSLEPTDIRSIQLWQVLKRARVNMENAVNCTTAWSELRKQNIALLRAFTSRFPSQPDSPLASHATKKNLPQKTSTSASPESVDGGSKQAREGEHTGTPCLITVFLVREIVAIIPPFAAPCAFHILGGKRGDIASKITESMTEMTRQQVGAQYNSQLLAGQESVEQENNQEISGKDKHAHSAERLWSQLILEHSSKFTTNSLKLMNSWLHSAEQETSDALTFSGSIISILQAPLFGLFSSAIMAVSSQTAFAPALHHSRSRRLLKKPFSILGTQHRTHTPADVLKLLRQNSRHDVPIACPVFLLTSMSLRCLPWELACPDRSIVRTPSKHNMETYIQSSCQPQAANQTGKLAVIVQQLGVEQMDWSRSTYIGHSSQYAIHHELQPQVPVQSDLSGRPCQFPLIKSGRKPAVLRRKYKSVKVIEYTGSSVALSRMPSTGNSSGKNCLAEFRATIEAAGEKAVILMPLCDWVIHCYTLDELTREHPSIAVMLVPATAIKPVMKLLTGSLDKASSGANDGSTAADGKYQHQHSICSVILACAMIIRTVWKVPAILLAPPAPMHGWVWSFNPTSLLLQQAGETRAPAEANQLAKGNSGFINQVEDVATTGSGSPTEDALPTKLDNGSSVQIPWPSSVQSIGMYGAGYRDMSMGESSVDISSHASSGQQDDPF